MYYFVLQIFVSMNFRAECSVDFTNYPRRNVDNKIIIATS